jgi:hypothetical protein
MNFAFINEQGLGSAAVSAAPVGDSPTDLDRSNVLAGSISNRAPEVLGGMPNTARGTRVLPKI